MLKQILTDKVDKLWEECQDRNIGSNEAELDFKASIVDLMISEKALKKNNVKNYLTYFLFIVASFITLFCIFSFVFFFFNLTNWSEKSVLAFIFLSVCTYLGLIIKYEIKKNK